jgi:hypothetical protein
MKKYTEQVFENKNSGMTVGELKKIIQDLDDNMKIGGAGHFGEYLECLDVKVREVSAKKGWKITDERVKILSFTIEDPGEEPD